MYKHKTIQKVSLQTLNTNGRLNKEVEVLFISILEDT